MNVCVVCRIERANFGKIYQQFEKTGNRFATVTRTLTKTLRDKNLQCNFYSNLLGWKCIGAIQTFEIYLFTKYVPNTLHKTKYVPN